MKTYWNGIAVDVIEQKFQHSYYRGEPVAYGRVREDSMGFRKGQWVVRFEASDEAGNKMRTEKAADEKEAEMLFRGSREDILDFYSEKI